MTRRVSSVQSSRAGIDARGFRGEVDADLAARDRDPRVLDGDR